MEQRSTDKSNNFSLCFNAAWGRIARPAIRGRRS